MVCEVRRQESYNYRNMHTITILYHGAKLCLGPLGPVVCLVLLAPRRGSSMFIMYLPSLGPMYKCPSLRFPFSVACSLMVPCSLSVGRRGDQCQTWWAGRAEPANRAGTPVTIPLTWTPDRPPAPSPAGVERSLQPPPQSAPSRVSRVGGHQVVQH